MNADPRLLDLARRPEQDWDLGYGALLIAASEYPDLDVASTSPAGSVGTQGCQPHAGYR